jgi:hypothetical protein
VIQVYRPAREIEDILSGDGSRVKVTDVQLADGQVQYQIQHNGQPRMFKEDPWQTLQALRVVGATLTAVDFKYGNIYCTVVGVIQVYIPAGFLEKDWSLTGPLVTLTGVRLAGDGMDYEVLDAGRPDVKHETEELVLRNRRITGAKLTGVELKGGDVYYTVAESS